MKKNILGGMYGLFGLGALFATAVLWLIDGFWVDLIWSAKFWFDGSTAFAIQTAIIVFVVLCMGWLTKSVLILCNKNIKVAKPKRITAPAKDHNDAWYMPNSPLIKLMADRQELKVQHEGLVAVAVFIGNVLPEQKDSSVVKDLLKLAMVVRLHETSTNTLPV